METLHEPWLRGPMSGLDPLIAPILYAFEQAREDLRTYTCGLITEQIWATPHSLGSVGFHINHIAGSTDRLITYLQGKQLSEAQMTALHAEHHAGASLDEILGALDSSFQHAEAVVLSPNAANLTEPREVGRKRLPTTVIGLLTHIAEHTQRHVGQAICAAKMARAS